MGYAIAAILVLLIVAGAVTFFALNAARRPGGAAPGDPGAEGQPAGIAAPDESPAGDTTQVSEAGEAEGRDTGQDADKGPGSDRPRVGAPGPEA
jgi:hypothetical protein